jgi:hypothetical protein
VALFEKFVEALVTRVKPKRVASIHINLFLESLSIKNRIKNRCVSFKN